MAAARGGAFDCVVNAAGTASLDQAIAALASGGDIVLMGLFDQAQAATNFVGLVTKGGTVCGTSVGSAMAYRDMTAFIDRHGVKGPIAQRFALAEAISRGCVGRCPWQGGHRCRGLLK